MASVSFGQWLISSSSVGEELAARVEHDGLLAMVFGTPRKRDARKFEERLRHLIEEAHEEARTDRGPRPIPAVLHHSLTRMLEWLGKVDGSRHKDQMTALLLFESEHDVAFGHLGGGEPMISVDGEPVEVDWVRIEDKKGREARGFSLYARAGLELAMEWSLVAGGASLSKSVFAEWRGSEESSGRPRLRLFESTAPSSSASLEEPVQAEEPALSEEAKSSAPAVRPDLKLVVSPATSHTAADEFRSDLGTAAEHAAPELDATPSAPAMQTPSIPSAASVMASADATTVDRRDPAPAPTEVEAVAETSDSDVTDLPSAETRTEAAAITRTTGFFKWLDRIVARRSEGGDRAELSEDDASTSESPVPVASSSDIAAAFAQPVAEEASGGASETPSAGLPRPPVIEITPRALEIAPTAAAPTAPAPPATTSASAPARERSPSPMESTVSDSGVDRPIAASPSVATPPSSGVRPPQPMMAAAPAPAPARVEAEAPRTRPVLEIVASPLDSSAAPARKPARRVLRSQTTSTDALGDPRARAAREPEVVPAPAAPPTPVRTVVVPARRPRRPAWPAAGDLHQEPSRLRKILPMAAVVALLFGGGWMLGRVQSSSSGPNASPSPLTRAMRAIGFAPPRFECRIESEPAGAWIAVDGKSVNRLTPATLDLSPGTHTVTLTVPDFGSTSFEVQGQANTHARLDAPLGGTLTVRATDHARAIEVSVDGVDRGVAPVTVRDLAPGAHEVRFSSPGLTPWGQTVRVGVREDAEILARPFQSPATGLIEVKASYTDEDGVRAIQGATVYVDGRRRGTTPLTLELSAGPHSIRVTHRESEAPVQVIDLPGGNQRFASFQFGLGIDPPRFSMLGDSGPMPRDRPSVVSVALEEVSADEVREMWLHVRSPEGVWRRYPMEQLEGSGAVVGVVVFPLAMLDGKGRAPYYASAATTLGDEYFTELQNIEPPAAPARPRVSRVEPMRAIEPTAETSQPAQP